MPTSKGNTGGSIRHSVSHSDLATQPYETSISRGNIRIPKQLSPSLPELPSLHMNSRGNTDPSNRPVTSHHEKSTPMENPGTFNCFFKHQMMPLN